MCAFRYKNKKKSLKYSKFVCDLCVFGKIVIYIQKILFSLLLLLNLLQLQPWSMSFVSSFVAVSPRFHLTCSKATFCVCSPEKKVNFTFFFLFLYRKKRWFDFFLLWLLLCSKSTQWISMSSTLVCCRHTERDDNHFSSHTQSLNYLHFQQTHTHKK